MSVSSQPGHDRFRILLYRRNGNQLLLERNAQGFALPDVRIPPYTRVAQQINQAISKDWRLQSFCLFSVGDANRPAYAVELCGAGSTQPANMNWIPVDSLAQKDFPEAQDFHAIATATKLFDQYRNAGAAEPFGKFGWFRDLTEWVESKARGIGLHLTGNFQQFNASPTFSLVRFETNGPAVWFKAVGEPNLHEFPITLSLAKYFSAYTPKLLAAKEDWNGWLSLEASGMPLSEYSGLDDWMSVASCLARLQISSCGQTLHLLDVGCRDLRSNALARVTPPFLELMTELMAQQTKISPAPLSKLELRELATQLLEAISAFEQFQVPNTLGHLDFNPGNILLSRDECVFLDWAEACVGSPFFTFQYLVEHWRRTYGADPGPERSLVAAYSKPWSRPLNSEQIRAALRLTPLLALFAYAAGSSGCRDRRTITPEAARHLRSLARRLKREADFLTAKESTCNS
jgi:hypothetical protein